MPPPHPNLWPHFHSRVPKILKIVMSRRKHTKSFRLSSTFPKTSPFHPPSPARWDPSRTKSSCLCASTRNLFSSRSRKFTILAKRKFLRRMFQQFWNIWSSHLRILVNNWQIVPLLMATLIFPCNFPNEISCRVKISFSILNWVIPTSLEGSSWSGYSYWGVSW